MKRPHGGVLPGEAGQSLGVPFQGPPLLSGWDSQEIDILSASVSLSIQWGWSHDLLHRFVLRLK